MVEQDEISDNYLFEFFSNNYMGCNNELRRLKKTDPTLYEILTDPAMTVMKGNGKLILHNVLVGRASDSLFEGNAYDMILNEAVFSNKTGMENTLGKQAAHK